MVYILNSCVVAEVGNLSNTRTLQQLVAAVARDYIYLVSASAWC